SVRQKRSMKSSFGELESVFAAFVNPKSQQALEHAASQLSSEAGAAKAEATAAGARVREIIGRIQDGDAHAIAARIVANRTEYWRLLDQLAGLVVIDDGREGGPRLRELQEETVQKIDRRKA